MDMSQLDQVNNAKSTIVFLEIIVVDHFLKLVLSQTTCLQFVALGIFLQIVKIVVPHIFFANFTSCCSKMCFQILQIIIAHNYFL